MFIIIVVIFCLIAFSQIGLAAFIVLPMTVAAVTALFSFFAMLGGVPGSGGIFLVSGGITAGGFALMALYSNRS